jgi:hypothetical protein
MAAVQTSLLVLLDLDNQHMQFEQVYNAQFFVRFIDKARCVLHVLSSRPRVRLLHFFIPYAEKTLISTRTIFTNTIYYIYCVDEATVQTIERTHNYPMFVKAFHAELLSTYLHQAAIAYLVENAERNRHVPDEYDLSLQAAADHATRLAEELDNHMIVQTGVQPEDLR